MNHFDGWSAIIHFLLRVGPIFTVFTHDSEDRTKDYWITDLYPATKSGYLFNLKRE